VPRYYFDINDGELQRDEEGLECADLEAAREKVIASLQDVAGLISPSDGDNQAISVAVRGEDGSLVYEATLTFTGSRLNQAA
jgi:hypothetical protein